MTRPAGESRDTVALLMTRPAGESRDNVALLMTRPAGESRDNVALLMTRPAGESRDNVAMLMTRPAGESRDNVALLMTRPAGESRDTVALLLKPSFRCTGSAFPHASCSSSHKRNQLKLHPTIFLFANLCEIDRAGIKKKLFIGRQETTINSDIIGEP